MSALPHLVRAMTGAGELEEEDFFELLEIGLYFLVLLTQKSKIVTASSVKGNFIPGTVRHNEKKYVLKRFMSRHNI